MLLAVIWTEASLGAIVMIARIFTKSYIACNLGWDDFWMIMTWVWNTSRPLNDPLVILTMV